MYYCCSSNYFILKFYQVWRPENYAKYHLKNKNFTVNARMKSTPVIASNDVV